LNDNTSYLCTADYGWVTGIYYNLLFPMLTGVHSYLIKNLNGFSLLKSLKYFKEWKIEHLYTSPLFLKMAYRFFKNNRTDIKSFYSVGEKLPSFLREKYHDLGYNIVDTWWQTELGCISISNNKAEKGMGIPLSFVNTALLIDNKVYDEKNKSSKTGELLIEKESHPSIMSGYYHDEKVNRNKFIGKYYRTGDLVKISKDGHFEYNSRVDDVIVLAGELISPDEVESLIMKQFGITELSYVMCDDNKIRLFVTKVVDEEKIKKAIFSELSPVMVPYEIVFIENLPKTESSKIKKSELRRYFSNE
jgi:acetyl-CoA synthetase